MIQGEDYKYKYISTNTTTDVKSSQGILHAVIVGTTGAGTITIYDESTGGSTTVVALLKASIAEGTYTFNCKMAKGIQVVTGAAAQKITVIYR